ncbi:glycogen debranching protein GlgX [Bosea sp. ANAM02]|uniref:glycogen debranching protein GlgX n=1 Tax=Bosea sp. ANAM02 TaxID=2020412 RepID=UPI00140F2695|nr:glycogen debranching protein GlgX [Bosea sp. ANAM02]BCB18602.1 glycogen operon protein GlgX homolog [Bosea sp. ANAM02]
MGASIVEDGVSFAVFSRHGTRVLVSVFDADGETEVASLPLPGRDGDIHYGLLQGVGTGLRYGLRVEGPWQPELGHRFDPAKLLVDPYATMIDRPFRWDPELARHGAQTSALVPRCIVQPHPAALPALGETQARPGPPSLIYELGVRSFSMRHPAVPKALRGTLAALREPSIIAHLRDLGVSHVELMPVAAWMDERHLPPLGLANAWGYNPVNFFALDPRLAPTGPAELAALCTAYAEAGIGVTLDVVLNHTAESDESGATISLRGLDNAVYYRHAADDPGRLVNDTGCGHTLALDRAPVVRLAMDALRYWLRLGVAGFRFDLATVMGRTDQGFTPDAPLFGSILQDPELSRAILIAEPWDIGPGGYRAGAFPAPFAEWNGRFRDDVRRFWRGDAGVAGAFATRLAGSSDLFAGAHRRPRSSINFVAAHDGFTLRDLVSHERKHNETNGEQNRDGDNDNHSWNCGSEGPTRDPAIEQARHRDIRALLATLFLARGVPMLTAGDEFGRTQNGNNNAYAQDNPTSWLDWERADRGLVDYTAALAALRRRHPLLSAGTFLTGHGNPPDATWLKPDGSAIADHEWPGLDAFCLVLNGSDESLLIAVNRSGEAADMTLPAGRWTRLFASDDGPKGLLSARSVALWQRG